MTTDDEKNKKKVRGRKLGVKIFQEVYQPEMASLFDDRIEKLGDRASWKERDLLEAIKSQLPFDESLDKVLTLLTGAENKEKKVAKLEKEAEMLREKANKIMTMTKAFTLDTEGLSYNGPTPVAELEIEHTRQILDMLKIAMMLQPEWLTLQEAQAMKKDFLSKLNRCVTMDQCTELIEEARVTIAKMSK
jgi:hypothetical protein